MNAADPIEQLKQTPIEPLTLVCRVCKKSISATDTVQVMTHMVEEHPNAVIVASGIFTLLAASHLFEATDDPARWRRNQAVFEAESAKALTATLGEGLTSLEDLISSGAAYISRFKEPPTIAPEPPPRHRERAGRHNRSKRPGANETGY